MTSEGQRIGRPKNEADKGSLKVKASLIKEPQRRGLGGGRTAGGVSLPFSPTVCLSQTPVRSPTCTVLVLKLLHPLVTPKGIWCLVAYCLAPAGAMLQNIRTKQASGQTSNIRYVSKRLSEWRFYKMESPWPHTTGSAALNILHKHFRIIKMHVNEK